MNYQFSLGASISEDGIARVKKQIEQIGKNNKIQIDLSVNDAINSIQKQLDKIEIETIKSNKRVEAELVKLTQKQVEATAKIEAEKIKSNAKTEAENIKTTQKQIDANAKLEAEIIKANAKIEAEHIKSNDRKTESDRKYYLATEKFKYKQQQDQNREIKKEEDSKNKAWEKDVAAFNRMSSGAKEATKSVMTFGEQLQEAYKKFSIWSIATVTWYAVVRAMKDMVDQVKELDKSLTELVKVVDMSDTQLKSFTANAFRVADTLGRTGKEVIDATGEFVKAGYSINEAMEMAQAALVMKNVGDGISDTAEATGVLIASLKGFKASASDSMGVVDKLNEVSNTSAISFKELAEGVQRVSGVLAQTGNTMDETIGLLVGGFEPLRNIEVVSRGLNTVSQRIRGLSEEGEKLEDGFVPKLQKTLKDIAKVDLTDQNGQLRSTFSILSDVAKVYPTLTSNQKQYLTEAMAGNQLNRVLVAILDNWKSVDQAVQSSTDSMGSASVENARYLDSIEGRINKLASAWQEFSSNAIDSDMVKSIIEFGTNLLKLADDVGASNLALVALLGTMLAIPGTQKLVVAGLISISNAMGGAALATTSLKLAWGGLIAALAIGVIVSIVKVVDELTVTLDEQREIVEKYSSAVKSLTSNIDELKSKQGLSAEEKARLKYLENRLVVEKELLRIEAQKLADKEWKDKGRPTGFERTVGMTTTVDQKNLALLKESNDELEKLINNKVQVDAIGEGKLVFDGMYEFVESFEKSRDSILETVAALKPLRDSLVAQKELGAKLTEEQEAYIDGYDRALQIASDLYAVASKPLPNPNPLKPTIDSLKANIPLVIAGYKDVEGAMVSLAKLHDMITSKEYKQSEAVKFLMDNYDGLVAAGVNVSEMLSDIDNLGEYVEQSFADQAIAAGLAYSAMTGFTQTYMGVTGEAWKSLYSSLNTMYGGDLTNFKSLAVEKSKIENELIKVLGQNWSTYYKSTSQGLSAALGVIRANIDKAETLGRATDVVDLTNQYDTLLAMQRMYESFETVELNLKEPSFSDYFRGNKSKSGDKAQVYDATEEIIRQVNAETEKLKLQNEQLKNQKELLEISENTTASLRVQRDIIDNQYKQTKSIIDANIKLQKLFDGLAKKSKYDVSTWFDENYESTVAYKKLLNSVGKDEQKAIETLFTQLQMYQKATIENEKTLKSLIIENSKLRIEWYQKELELAFENITQKQQWLSLEREIVDSNIALLKSVDGSQEYIDLIGKATVNSQKQMEEYGKTIDSLQKKFDNLQAQNKSSDISSWYDSNLDKSYKFTQMLAKASADEQVKLLETWEKGKSVLSSLQNVNSEMSKLRTDIIKYNYEIISYVSKKEIEAINSKKDTEIKAINDRIDLLKKEQEEKDKDTKKEKDRLKAQKERYKESIDLLKEALRLEDELRKYQQDISDKEKEISKIQNQMSDLTLDGSAEALQKRAALEEDFVKLQRDLAEKQRDRYVKIQSDTYDKSYNEYSKSIDNQIDELDRLLEASKEATEKTTKELRDSIEKITEDAKTKIDVINNQANTLYTNMVTGTMNLNTEVLKIADSWDVVLGKMKSYSIGSNMSIGDMSAGSGESGVAYVGSAYIKDGKVASKTLTIRDGPSTSASQIGMFRQGDKVNVVSTDGLWSKIKLYHDGGVVGNNPNRFVSGLDKMLRDGEVPAILKKDEGIYNDSHAENFFKTILPQISGSGFNSNLLGTLGGITFDNLINVEGNLDNSVLPKLDKITKSVLAELAKILQDNGRFPSPARAGRRN